MVNFTRKMYGKETGIKRRLKLRLKEMKRSIKALNIESFTYRTYPLEL